MGKGRLRKQPSTVDEMIAEQIEAGIALFSEYVGPLNHNQENSIRALEEKFARSLLHIAVIQMSNDQEAIKRLCHEVLNLASDDACVEYGDKLRAMVQDFAIGLDAYQERYPQREAHPLSWRHHKQEEE